MFVFVIWLVRSCHVLPLLGFNTWIVKPASVEQECGEGDEGGKTAEHRPVVFQVLFFQKIDKQKTNKLIRIRMEEKDGSPDSKPEFSEVSILVGEEWGEAGGGAVQRGRPSQRAADTKMVTKPKHEKYCLCTVLAPVVSCVSRRQR